MTCKAVPGMSSLWNFFSGNTPSDQEDVCRALSGSVDSLSRQGVSSEEARNCLRAALDALENPQQTGAAHEILVRFAAADLPARLLESMEKLDFEARKDATRLFSETLRLGGQPVVEYVQGHPRIVTLMLDGCGDANLALHCNRMLCACTRHPQLVASLLEAGVSSRLIRLCQNQSFDVSSDAFNSLRELLLTHKAVSAAYLERNFAEFFGLFNELLRAGREDYVTQRQALKILGEILLDRQFMEVMLTYVSDENFLQIHMNLLRENSKAIQLDAFHVFKIYAANPKKPPRVQQILFKNRDRLVRLLESIQPNREDESFLQDRKAVVQALMALEQPKVSIPPTPAAAASSTSASLPAVADDSGTSEPA
eukprot:gnl/TRDRNA2_/TRDRNA2_180624_c0_seq1.p1 gnl/TRDRNA2_/TRDRNA2_180624_c0~~gnl/TRDRNA2_/TRDRNA2_180624_c0_seq1.p1  ORF type:complete len:368 (-),score=68.78 gnl/TRDRNA2_/TRDRNA2_180624_c0_seq1:234-1337(-)